MLIVSSLCSRSLESRIATDSRKANQRVHKSGSARRPNRALTKRAVAYWSCATPNWEICFITPFSPSSLLGTSNHCRSPGLIALLLPPLRSKAHVAACCVTGKLPREREGALLPIRRSINVHPYMVRYLARLPFEEPHLAVPSARLRLPPTPHPTPFASARKWECHTMYGLLAAVASYFTGRSV